MKESVQVYSTERKFVIVDGQSYLCDIIHNKKESSLVRGENFDTGEKTDWITVDEPINAAFRFGDYLKENKKYKE